MERNKNESIKYWLLICGILNVVFYLLHDCIGARFYPGYNWMAQAVSDLTATDAPSRLIASELTKIHAILGLYLFVTMHWISAIGYSLFPLTGSGYDGSLQSFVHVYVITVLVVLLSIVSLILIAAGGFKSGNKVLAWCAVVAFLLMFLGAAGSGLVPRQYFGIPERFSTYSAVCFTAVIAVIAFLKFGKIEA